MRLLIIFFNVILTIWVVQSSPLKTSVVRISYLDTKQATGAAPPQLHRGRIPERPSPRKGEYNCGPNGNMLCKLKPGEIPKGCNGVCQYRI